MQLPKIRTIAGAVTSIFGVLAAGSKLLSVSKIESLHVGFAVFLFQRLWPEIICIIAIGLILLLPNRFWRSLSRIARYAFVEPYVPFTNRSLLIATVSILFFGGTVFIWWRAIPVIVEAARTRAIYDKTMILTDYRHLLIRRALICERFGQLERARDFCQQITVFFASPRWESKNQIVAAKVKYLTGLMNYANLAFETAKGKGDVPDRDNWGLLLTAASIYAQTDIITLLDRWRQKLTDASPVPNAFHRAVRSQNVPLTMQLYNQWAWYLFDDGVRHDLDSAARNGNLMQKLSVIVNNVSEVTFKNAVERSWQLPKGNAIASACHDAEKEFAQNRILHRYEDRSDLPMLLGYSPEESDLSTEDVSLPESTSDTQQH